MIIQFSIEDIERIRELILTYPPDMDLKHFFVSLDSWIKSNKNIYCQNHNAIKVVDPFETKNSDWYPIIKKSIYINNLFNQIGNLCAQDQNY